jgi:hypothetical protein
MTKVVGRVYTLRTKCFYCCATIEYKKNDLCVTHYGKDTTDRHTQFFIICPDCHIKTTIKYDCLPLLWQTEAKEVEQ